VLASIHSVRPIDVCAYPLFALADGSGFHHEMIIALGIEFPQMTVVAVFWWSAWYRTRAHARSLAEPNGLARWMAHIQISRDIFLRCVVPVIALTVNFNYCSGAQECATCAAGVGMCDWYPASLCGITMAHSNWSKWLLTQVNLCTSFCGSCLLYFDWSALLDKRCFM